MFMHLGADNVVKLKDILIIINAENGLKSASTIHFLKKAESEGKIEKIEGDNYKSIVVTDSKIYYSPISSQTLKKRANFVAELA